jgi:hypothetical protein
MTALMVGFENKKYFTLRRLGTEFLNLFVKDIAVGAPYDGEGSSGIVYIYHGNADGLSLQPDQVKII